jgi:hypothetical protein
MLAWIAYCMGTVAAGLLLAFIAGIFLTGPSQRVEKPYRILVYSLGFTMLGPFLYCEALTQAFGDPMGHAIRQCYNESEIQGPMQYYKLTRYTGDHAIAIVIGQEKEGWGGNDRPILQVLLSQHGTSWVADSYTVVYSYRLNKDGIIFPPYQ